MNRSYEHLHKNVGVHVDFDLIDFTSYHTHGLQHLGDAIFESN